MTKGFCREHGISISTFYQWKQNYGGMNAQHLKELKALASMQNEISQFYQGLVLVRGWHPETYKSLYNKVIKNMKLNHEGVQYGTIQAIREAENNWGVLGMAGETAAMIAAEGLFPVDAGRITPKGVTQKSNINPSSYEDAIAAENLRSYRRADIYVDCSDLASSYNKMYKGGYILEIKPASGRWLNGIEYGKKETFTYHQVYVKGGYVYDPMYSGTPIKTKDYIKIYQKMNPQGIKLQRQ
ncbi:transposase [uncultured Chryseobacterium sp.]|uniref:transposase n=1 Tax=uncultured Chryseobacterium sp. TaxID=259322 RepID=UPI0025F70D14|nr:transposase [uncultured Chryseobacterium sp.]